MASPASGSKARRRAEAVHYDAGGTRKRITAGLVLLHEGVIPNVQLSLSTRCRHVWDEVQECWHPETDEWGATSEERIAVAGDGAGIHGALAAEPLGRLAALDAAFRLGRIDQAERDREAAPERAATCTVQPHSPAARPPVPPGPRHAGAGG